MNHRGRRTPRIVFNVLNFSLRFPTFMGRACSTHWEEEKCIQGFGGKARRKETTRKTDVGGRIILKWVLEKWDGVVWTGFIWLKIGASGGLL
jgi:hypothetical protein